MQIVILAGGKGTRMREKTISTPKPLLEHKGKTLLEYKLDALPSQITEVVIVIGYLGDMIKDRIGNSYNSLPITYVVQEEQKGTAHALWCCKDILKEKFCVVMGDDIYDRNDLEKLFQTEESEWAVLVHNKTDLRSAEKFLKDDSDNLVGMKPDPEGLIPYNYLYTGACLLTPEIFSTDMVTISETEFGLPHTFVTFAPEKKIRIFTADNWRQISSPEDLE